MRITPRLAFLAAPAASGVPAILGALLALSGPALHAQTLVARLNCGGPAVTLSNGQAWLADRSYGPHSSFGYVGGAPVTVVSTQEAAFVGGWADPYVKLHATGREGWQAYRFDLPAGNYLLRLHFAEITLHGPTLRVFDVAAEGTPLLADLDLAAEHGIQYGASFTAPVHVSDGRLDVETGGDDPALLDGIEVWTAPASYVTPAAVTGTAASGSYGRNVLTWSPAAGPTLTGYRVYGADAAGGPFALLGTTWSGPARWFDADALAGQPRFYRVTAVNAGGLEGPPGATVSATALDAGLSTLPVYTLTVAPEDLAQLDALVLIDPDFTVPGTFGFDGRTWDVSVRYRGASSRVYSKKSWKVKFPATDTFEGQTDLNLKAHFPDHSLIREPVSLDLAHAIGHPAAEHAPAHLQVNGVYRGVFDRVEQIEVEYLKARDRDPGGSVYEVNADFSKEDTPEAYAQYYEKKTNESTGHADLIALIELVNDTPAAELELALAQVFDIDNLLSYFALIGFIADEDSIRHNGYLLHDLSLGRWEFIAWDNEGSWASAAQSQGATLPIDFGTEPAGIPFNALKTAVLEVPAWRWRYAEKLTAMLDGPAAVPLLAARISDAHAEVLVDGAADAGKRGWESNAAFDASPAGLTQFVVDRHAFLRAAIAAWQPPVPPTTVWINEFMADNVSTATDEAGQFEDWIELYNAAPAPADVGELYLTDDLSDPTQWQLPPGTVIPALGHLRIWADDDAGDGPLHAGFKLSAQGEALGLFAADGVTLLDLYHFRPQLPDVSEGRLPDGGAFLRLLAAPSPGAPNTGAGNLPPLVTWVEHAPAVVTPFDAVAITARATDADGVVAVTLHASVDGGPSGSVPMQPIGADRYEAALPPQPLGTVVEYWIEATDTLGAAGAKPTHAPDDTYTWSVGASAPIGVRISEVMADNAGTLTDEAGDLEDWVELVNTTGSAVDLSGFHLTDNFGNPTTWAFPAGTELAPFAHLLVWADSEPLEGPLHAGFKLSKSGEAVGLFHPDGVTLVDGFAFGQQQTDVGYGRMPDGAEVLVFLLDPSPGAPNVPADGGHARFDAGNVDAGGPELAGAGLAQVGGTVTWQATGAPANASGLTVIGVQTLLAPTLAKGTLLVAPLVLLPQAFDAQGAATLALPVPDDPLFDHLVVHVQMYAAGARLGNAVTTRLAP
jgi:hypothetical protein